MRRAPFLHINNVSRQDSCLLIFYARKGGLRRVKKLLSPRQRAFCDEYLIDLNATQAAIRAGYSKRSAGKIGAENLARPHVQEYLRERMAQKESELIATQDEVLKFLTAVMRGKVDETMLTNKGEPIEIPSDTSDRIRAAELIGKRYGTWTDKVDVDADTQLTVHIDYGDGGDDK